MDDAQSTGRTPGLHGGVSRRRVLGGAAGLAAVAAGLPAGSALAASDTAHTPACDDTPRA